MTRKLTETAVHRAGVPTIGQTMIWDQAVTGFAVRILPGGSRTFWFLYRTSGGPLRQEPYGPHRVVAHGLAQRRPQGRP